MTACLEVNGVTKSFGGMDVLRDVTLTLGLGEVRLLIGPNGAGKSTLFKLIAGLLRPNAGEIRVGGVRVDSWPPHRLRRLGLSQAFQTPRVVSALTVTENLMLALNPGRSLVARFWSRRYGSTSVALAREVLGVLGLQGRAKTSAGSLPPGGRKLLELGMVLIQEPRLALIDEPTAGMTPADIIVVNRVVQRLKDKAAVLIIEHDMAFVRDLDEPVMVLHNGAIVRQGKMSELSRDPFVHEIYFGRHLVGGAS